MVQLYFMGEKVTSIYIPLFNESLSYAKKIDLMVRRFNYSKLNHKKLVNLIHRYDTRFYEAQKAVFLNNSSGYANLPIEVSNDHPNLLKQKVSSKAIVRLLVKAFAHTLFRLLGFMQLLFIDKDSIKIIRKSYVDDVEGLFDLDENVVRFVYPFPLNLQRQYRYIKYLRENNIRYVFIGLPYNLQDYYKLLVNGNYLHFQRLELRAHLRDALALKNFRGLELVQCAEEYDIGSLVYSLALKRRGIVVYNRAHGVGKYLPYHYYAKFNILTQAQEIYYGCFNRGDHRITPIKKSSLNVINYGNRRVICLLGQASASAPDILLSEEIRMLEILNVMAEKHQKVVFVYKKHPNNSGGMLNQFDKIKFIGNVLVGGEPNNVLQMSLYSTCQIDTNFIGEKVLIETDLIKPQLVYLNFEKIVNILALEDFLYQWLAKKGEKI